MDIDFNFNKIIDRHNTGSLKYDCCKQRGRPEGIIPMWIADMDFKTHPRIIEALRSVAEHGIYGYSEPQLEYFPAMKNWFSRRFNFHITEESHFQTPGIVFALAHAIKAFTKENDAIIIQQPVYYPFIEIINKNNRKLINSPLIFDGERYRMRFEDFEQKIIDNKVVMFMLCSPHNPVGRVWHPDELKRIGDICLKHGVIVVADEIHADFVYSNSKHHVFSTVDPKFADISMICTSRGKSFNQAGLQVSDIFVTNSDMRARICDQIEMSGYSQRNTFGLVGAKVAYECGEEWLDALLIYLESNRDFVATYLKTNLPEIKVTRCEGTFLAWLDFRSLKLSQDELNKKIVSKANLWLDCGRIFGDEGIGFQRLNFACSRAVLENSLSLLTRIKS
ncbi:MAG: pyridoxal phosphate-dependent aminotransferase [Christensenellaceae bacterium]|jgi:cystathionine beta-lyase|nr:pyridoxal phosphate-dependent aminotransferase [Christensenellaceae bacterium]